MHETVTSPKEYRSRHGLMVHGDAAVVEGSYADDGRVFKPSGVTPGQDRSFRTASCGVAPGDAGGQLPGAYRHPDQIPRPPPDRIARIGRPAGAIQGIIPPRSACSLPAADEVAEPRRSLKLL